MVKLGTFKASLIPCATSIAVGIAIWLCQVIAVKLGHEKPYPAATISRTADHYPEFVIFRITTEGGATLLIMTWFMNYFLMRSKWSKVQRYAPEVSIVLGTLGALALMGSTATLDTGKHNTDWHVKCATSFFVLTIVASLYNTFITYMVQKNTRSFNRVGLYAKYIVSAFLAVWLYLALFYKSPNKNFGNIVEYTLAYLILAYQLIIAYDMKDWNLQYELS